jgi:hypothetical protein
MSEKYVPGFHGPSPSCWTLPECLVWLHGPGFAFPGWNRAPSARNEERFVSETFSLFCQRVSRFRGRQIQQRSGKWKDGPWWPLNDHPVTKPPRKYINHSTSYQQDPSMYPESIELPIFCTDLFRIASCRTLRYKSYTKQLMVFSRLCRVVWKTRNQLTLTRISLAFSWASWRMKFTICRIWSEAMVDEMLMKAREGRRPSCVRKIGVWAKG